ncbi:MAG: type I phosphomannose isomerase catalytic subunit [Candidatus Korobacteraceae bacterium]|jgi:mannose-6-phosphate isomerase
MSELYPLLLVPEFDERPWGTRDLRPFFTQVVGHEPIGEAWLTGDACRIANGPHSGATLADLCRRFGVELVGEAAPQPDRFPLLTKFIFPRDKLSVQVHPDDRFARELGEPWGKTECWYVARCLPGSQVALGLREGASKREFEVAIRENRAEELLNWIELNQGDLIYVEAGTVHTIGPGSILIETQQNSDTTFRLYDYGRGRQLHLDQGLRAMREDARAGKVLPRAANGHDLLVSAPSFVVERYSASEPLSLTASPGLSSAHILVAVEGGAIVESENAQPVSFNRGEVLVIPASLRQVRLRPQWTVEFLRMRVPGEPLEPPQIATLAGSLATPFTGPSRLG